MPNAQISIEVWAVVGQWIIYGASLTGAIMGIAQFIKWCRSKTTVAKLETIIQDHSKYLNNDNERIKALESRIEKVNDDLEDIHTLLRLNVKASQALLKSNLDGNNKEAVKDASEEIQEYMTKKI